MYGWKIGFGTAAAAVLVLSAGGVVQAAQAGPRHGETRANLDKAMRGEAFAYAEYSVFAEVAARGGHRDAARLFRKVADEELRDHFAKEARLSRFVGGNLANLRVAIKGESRDLVDYARWARDAAAERCHAVARLFTGVRKDEAGHLARYTAAAKALENPRSGVRVPAPVKSEPAHLRVGGAVCGKRVVRDLRAAMAGESFANARYTLYADHARVSGQPRLAALFKGAAAVELRDHFTAEAGYSGLIGDTAANLRAAIAAEEAAIREYGSYAQTAAREGDRAAAGLFRGIRGDEMRHRAAFRAALAKLRPGHREG